MYIEEITIDGFKSFAKRTTVQSLDPCFNAITGLNGSGKSNILDSICFVLGITNLTQVRAGSLQELVYKSGQAGVTKASVSIVFNNSDKASSPVGYEHNEQITVTRQLVIGGRNKYMINGRNAELERVRNMFHSVQLNVNNPHFLIMQGRITKVLNMKPAEVLGMLEEAAGTRMYETKKDGALKTLEKKEIKVKEIETVLSQDILPALEKLRHERNTYMEWQSKSVDLERQSHFTVAHTYTDQQRKQKEAEEALTAKRGKLAKLAEGRERAEQQAAAATERLEELRADREKENGALVRQKQEVVAACVKEAVTRDTAWQHRQQALEAEREGVTALEAQRAELDGDGLAVRLQEATAAREAAHTAHEKAKADVEAAQREVAGAEAGDGRDESNRSLAERLSDAQQAQTAAEADLKAAAVREKHAAKQLKELKAAALSKAAESDQLDKTLKKQQAAVRKLESQLAALGHDAEEVQRQQEVVEKEGAEAARCRSAVDELSSQLGGMDFRYSNPGQGFNPASVKGALGRLVQGAKSLDGANTSTALEVAAGGKLYQVVVDTAATGKALLQRGKLRNRVTLVPLDKVDSRARAMDTWKEAKRLVGDAAVPALSLVEYDPSVDAAMRYAFGSTFICKDQETAQKIAMQSAIKVRCVTLEGDDFNPGGLLTGGSRRAGGSSLQRVFQLQAVEAELAQHQAALQRARQQLAVLQPTATQHDRLTKELELNQHELSLLEVRDSQSEKSQLAFAATEAEAQLEAAKAEAEKAKARRAQMVDTAKALERDIKNFDKERGARLKTAQAKLKAAKAAVERARTALRQADAALTAATAEGEAAEKERAELDAQIAAVHPVIAGLEKEVAELHNAVEAANTAAEEARAALEEVKSAAALKDAECKDLARARAQAQDRAAEAATNLRKLESELKAMDKSIGEFERNCEQLVKEHPWIPSQKHLFGIRGGDYDFGSRDAQAEYKRYTQLKQHVDDLTKTVNKKVMQMFDKAEEDSRELSEKKRVVEADRAKIEKVIAELDEKKKEQLRLTWEKVNADFGSIFAMLLPGTSAKLQPPEGADFLQGLEVKVAFGGVWKQSLTELSGGQRSLLALSLILAMLLFKPAPIYILDEVDAALDLSHTQNIGRMIKAHFPQSQFIVVSLKEGMFNNANVLFRTKFVDGVSTVTRCATRRSPEEQAAAATKGARRGSLRPPLGSLENVGA